MDVVSLRSGDVSRLRELNALFGEAFFEIDTYGDEPPSDAYLASWLRNGKNIALVVIEGDAVIGGLAAYVLDKFERERSEIYIYDLAVAENHRRRGAATALLRRLQEIASDVRAWVIYVQADYGDDPAIALYEKLGTREEVLHFDIPVVPVNPKSQ